MHVIVLKLYLDPKITYALKKFQPFNITRISSKQYYPLSVNLPSNKKLQQIFLDVIINW